MGNIFGNGTKVRNSFGAGNSELISCEDFDLSQLGEVETPLRHAIEPRILLDAAATETADMVADDVAAEQVEAWTKAIAQDDIATTDVSTQPRSEILFVDEGVEDYQSIIAELDTSIEVFVLSSESDGVEQIAAHLSERSNVDAIHIISHGRSGTLDLGDTKLTAATMVGKHADEMTTIKTALNQDADILLYGCEFAVGSRGAHAVSALVGATGADVAASSDLTGAAFLGGDWDLEVEAGDISTASLIASEFNGVLIDTDGDSVDDAIDVDDDNDGILDADEGFVAAGPPKNIALIVDESQSIDATEAAQIRSGLTDFLTTQIGSGNTVSLIGMTDGAVLGQTLQPEADNRTDHVLNITFDGTITDLAADTTFDTWITNFRTVASQGGTHSDYWSTGLDVAANDLNLGAGDEVIIITDGAKGGVDTFGGAGTSAYGGDPTVAANHASTLEANGVHVFAIGVTNGVYYSGNLNFGGSLNPGATLNNVDSGVTPVFDNVSGSTGNAIQEVSPDYSDYATSEYDSVSDFTGLADALRSVGTRLAGGSIDTDGDGIANHLDLDSDNDGITDNIEAQLTGNYIAPNANSNPTYTANSGLNSAYVSSNGLTAVNTDGDAQVDYLDTDSDNEGGNDTAEAGLTGTATGLSNAGNDADGDGLFDVFDAQNGTTTNDGFVVNEGFAAGALAYPDGDGDAAGNAPLTADVDFRDAQVDAAPLDTDGDGIIDSLDVDDDNDGILDNVERSVDIATTAAGASAVSSSTLNTFVASNLIDGDSSNNTNTLFHSSNNSPSPFEYIDVDLGENVDIGFIEVVNRSGFGERISNAYILVSDTPFTAGLDIAAARAEADFEYQIPVQTVAGTDAISVDLGSLEGRYVRVQLSGTNLDNTTGLAGVINLQELRVFENIDTDSDGIFDHKDLDSDNDGITDNIEGQSTVGYVAPSGIGNGITDLNQDGLDDNYDTRTVTAATAAATMAAGTGIAPVNTDGDADADYLDTDSDNEGGNDTAEAGLTGIATGLSNAGNDADGDGLFDVFDTQNSTTTNDGFVVNEGLANGALAFPDGDGDAAGNAPLTADVDFRDTQFDVPAVDTDGDGVFNPNDIDDDNDGILDTVENMAAVDTNVTTTNLFSLDFSGPSNNQAIPKGVLNSNTNGGLLYAANQHPSNAASTNAGGFADITGPDGTTIRAIDANFGLSNSEHISSFAVMDSVDLLSGERFTISADFLKGSNLNNNEFGISFGPIGQDPVWNEDVGGAAVADGIYVAGHSGGILVREGGSGSTTYDASGTVGNGWFRQATTFYVTVAPDGQQHLFIDTTTRSYDSSGTLGAPVLTGSAVDMGLASNFPWLNDTALWVTADFFVANASVDVSFADTDGDGIANRLDLDSDNDGISDLVESGNTAGVTADTNYDGTITDAEALAAVPAGADQDNDGLQDVFDADTGNATSTASQGTISSQSDGDGIANFLDLDSDGDGIADAIEARPTSATSFITTGGAAGDSDNDGVLDHFDTTNNGTFGGNFVAPNDDDDDSDGIADYLDLDSDGDGISDAVESGLNGALPAAVTYDDADGTVASGALPNEFGDTSEVAFREVFTGPIIDLNDDNTTANLDFTINPYTENGGAVTVTDTDADVIDSTDDIVSLTIAVAGASNGDLEVLVVNGISFPLGTDKTDTTTSIGGVATTIAYVGGTITITPTDGTTPLPQASLDTFIRGITYEHTSENPTAGARTLTFNATDGAGQTMTSGAVSTITVVFVNDAPIPQDPATPGTEADAMPAQSGSDASALQVFNVSTFFSDPDDAVLTYSLGMDTPSWMSINATSGEITGTPPANASQNTNVVSNANGVYTIAVIATDPGGLTGDTTVNYTISNPAPNALDDAFATNEGDGNVTGNVITSNNGNGIDNDPDGDAPLSVTQVDGVAGNVGSATTGNMGGLFTITSTGGFTFDENNQFEGLAAGETRTTTITYQLSDGEGGFDSATASVTVTGTNDNPTVVVGSEIPDQTGNDAQTVTDINITGAFTDSDTNDVFQYTAIGLPAGLSLNINTGIISGTLDSSASQNGNVGPATDGVYDITVTANDQKGGSVSDTFRYTISNPAPVAVNDAFGAADGIDEDTAVTGLNVITGAGTDSDPDGDMPLTITQVNSNGALVGTAVTGDMGGKFTLNSDGTLAFDPNGEFDDLAVTESRTTSITYQLSDGEGGFSSASVTITVAGMNDNPVPTIPGDPNPPADPNSYIPVQSGADNQLVTPLVVSDYVKDPDGTDALTITIAPAELPPGLTFDGTTISGTLDPMASQGGDDPINAPGIYLIPVTVTDGKGGTFSTIITYNTSNPPPAAVNDMLSGDENTPLLGGDLFTANPTTMGSDPDGDTFTVTRVAAGNDVTALAALADGSGVAPTTVSGSMGGTFTVNANGGVDFDPGTDFQDLDIGESRITEIVYQIDDGEGGTDTAIVAYTVTGANDAPVIIDPKDTFPDPKNPPTPIDPNTVIPKVTAGESTAITPLDVTPYFYDVDGDPLTISLAPNAPPWLSINANGVITGTPPSDASIGGLNSDGVYNVTIIGTDDNGEAVQTIAVFTIENIPPETISNLPNQNETVGYDVNIPTANAFNDPDGDDLTFSATGLPGGLTIDPQTGLITGAIDQDAVSVAPNGDGIYTVIVMADDGQGGTTTQTFTYSLGDIPLVEQPPVEPPLFGPIDQDIPQAPEISEFSISDVINGLAPLNSGTGLFNLDHPLAAALQSIEPLGAGIGFDPFGNSIKQTVSWIERSRDFLDNGLGKDKFGSADYAYYGGDARATSTDAGDIIVRSLGYEDQIFLEVIGADSILEVEVESINGRAVPLWVGSYADNLITLTRPANTEQINLVLNVTNSNGSTVRIEAVLDMISGNLIIINSETAALQQGFSGQLHAMNDASLNQVKALFQKDS